MKKNKELKVPKPIKERVLKKQVITKLLKKYQEPIKFDGKLLHEPSDEDIKKYEESLKNLKLKELRQLQKFKPYNYKLDPLDRIKSINKKKHACVTIFNENKTTDTGVISSYDRTFSRGGMTYIVRGEKGRYDPEVRMQHYYYYSNCPWPIDFEKNITMKNLGEVVDGHPVAQIDGKMMDSIISMKVIEALANIDMDKKITLLVVFAICNVAMNLVGVFLLLKASGVV